MPWFEGRIDPPIERRARAPWPLTLQAGTPDVRLIGAAWRPRRHDHGPHPHPEVPGALSLDHPALLAQAVHLALRQHRLEDLAHLVTCHRLPLRVVPSCPMLQCLCAGRSQACGSSRVKHHRPVITKASG
jgi:hypothetical protein